MPSSSELFDAVLDRNRTRALAELAMLDRLGDLFRPTSFRILDVKDVGLVDTSVRDRSKLVVVTLTVALPHDLLTDGVSGGGETGIRTVQGHDPRPYDAQP